MQADFSFLHFVKKYSNIHPNRMTDWPSQSTWLTAIPCLFLNELNWTMTCKNFSLGQPVHLKSFKTWTWYKTKSNFWALLTICTRKSRGKLQEVETSHPCYLHSMTDNNRISYFISFKNICWNHIMKYVPICVLNLGGDGHSIFRMLILFIFFIRKGVKKHGCSHR